MPNSQTPPLSFANEMTRDTRCYTLCSVAICLALLSTVTSTRINFKNECPHQIDLWDNIRFITIVPNAIVTQDVFSPSLMWRHGYDPQATLAEFSIIGDGKAWYDISIIPPGSGTCTSFDECRTLTGRIGFNVGLAIVPRSNLNGYNCRAVYCLADRCPDAYQCPTDDFKTLNCPDTTEFDVIFCPGGVGAIVPTSAPTTPAPTPASYIKAKYTYRGRSAGNQTGSYSMITKLAGCLRQSVTLTSPVGPMSEDVSMVFRGPMELFNIVVYDGNLPTTSTSQWGSRVSWYKRGGAASNLYFMNNQNIDYTASGQYGPQMFASSDGKTGSTVPRGFTGSLKDAADPTQIGAGPGISTGVEVNIMTATRCTITGCKGFRDNRYSFRGWGGGKKIFIAQVQMPISTTQTRILPNQPAIWLLNAQVLYTGQYSTCNCRGIGPVGGCGELDIAEVIEPNSARDRVSTHYYFYDGVATAATPSGDNFASRPSTKATTYVTIIDDSGEGVIKILEVDQFDFNTERLSQTQVQAWMQV